nr:ribonucleoside-diphosphate reductase, adenosylcobalamin-dependent [Actinomycetota bacterium]NIS31887.1 ribonucleoside-diphosphate reductase, adenosylcobalamin-dependent [Actinomycetota bacterium]NIU66965.1 ribonucleoside-diphosphate reductase, adenosylcobalamin-dependent [Actinomycetota bacterium]NIV87553.1 ribonucleoside-diphosphate reductase, adenosylcobalamin-dependent [Actinomycetota bacterium]NIW28764.1 ribonucleoside-diphosphate reductase, adenosylcobalamin-dependent [Actinomycetota ba
DRDVREAYQLAFDLGCKGITVYREGSKAGQVLTHPGREGEACPDCGSTLRFAESTVHCRACGYALP